MMFSKLFKNFYRFSSQKKTKLDFLTLKNETINILTDGNLTE